MKTPLSVNRRTLIAGAGAAAAVGAVPFSTFAAAPKKGLLRPGIYRFGLGTFEVTSILDGAIQLDGPHPIFGENVEASDVAALAADNFLPSDRMEIGFTVTLVNTGRELVLFDTGNGARRRPNAGTLLETLDHIGIAPGDIDVVAITHFHGDHIGGLMEEGAPAFPNARYVMGQVEYDFWADEDLLLDDKMVGRAQLVQDNVVPHAEKTTFIQPGDSVVAGIEAVESYGHTPGHLCYHIENGTERLMVTGDVANHYIMSLEKPDWHVRFDMDKEGAVKARKDVFGQIAADKIPFVGYHMPSPAVGYVEELDGGFRYVPASYQLNL